MKIRIALLTIGIWVILASSTVHSFQATLLRHGDSAATHAALEHPGHRREGRGDILKRLALGIHAEVPGDQPARDHDARAEVVAHGQRAPAGAGADQGREKRAG